MAKGGMCKNPFGGCSDPTHPDVEAGKRCPVCNKKKNVRLDRLDLEQGTIVKGERASLIYTRLIANEMHNYLFFCLGNNGCTPDKFMEAYSYLFRVRSNKPETWGSRLMKTQKIENGRTKNVMVQLTDAEMRMGCFDVQYELSNMPNSMHIDRFLLWLQEERVAILRENEAQVRAYLEELRSKELKTVAPGRQLPLWVFGTDDPLKIMVAPSTFESLAQTLYVAEELKRPLEPKRPGLRPHKRKSSEEIALGASNGVPREPPDLLLSLV